ncbi:DNA-3-methyladenine glycosylase I [Nocardioides marmoriginsengisoli]|uniref:DNA-3-methyladenine glycosylase I n=1 Tax=Nocardioides marmoriginsengisoli TaxID=661483 RepID=A0A3N0CCS0_9ACTN|nr:DNA-3-methyladenine glycosylase I [Nocardioides marmoriginsengisoli]RNL61109.1 DNA-3-methyladenine glycosylase I [Nocardioides marmoriginsengisoli]
MSAAVVGEDGVARCPWGSAGVLRDYHDVEWGMPVRGEAEMFERLSLEGAQAGLSWLTILNKRDRYREVFRGFDVDAVAAMTDADLETALLDAGIVRNRAKVESVRRNARAAVELRPDGGLEAFVEGFAPTRTPRPRTTAQLPTTSPESLALSKALKKRGFSFVGPTTMYALFEATGIVDTHLTGCHRRNSSGRWDA